MSDQKTIIVATEFGDVTVKKLALLDYGKLLKALGKLPGSVIDMFTKADKTTKEGGKLDTDFVLSILPEVLADNLPEMVAILSAVTDKDVAFIGKLDPADILDIFDAALELNDYSRVVATIKKITARMRPKQPAPAAETPAK